MARSVQQSPWWTRRSPRTDPAEYHLLVRSASRRDEAAAQRGSGELALVSPASRELFAETIALSVHSEDVGGFAAETLLATGLPTDLRARLVRAMWDEIRHSDLFHQLGNRLELTAAPIDRAPLDRLLDVLDEASTAVEFALVHTELEALALDFFQLIAAAQSGCVIGETYRTVAADEATHVVLGRDIITHLCRRGLTVDSETVTRLTDAALSVTPLADPAGLEPLATVLGVPADALTRRLLDRRDQRVARTRALLDRR